MKKNIFLLCAVVVSSSALVALDDSSKGQACQAPTKGPEKPATQAPSIKKLTSLQMQLLDGFLLGYPLGVIRVDLAGKAALKVLQELSTSSDDPNTVKEQMHYVLTPIKQFFEVIHEYSSIIKPLVIESHSNDLQRKTVQLNQQQQVSNTDQLQQLTNQMQRVSINNGQAQQPVSDRDQLKKLASQLQQLSINDQKKTSNSPQTLDQACHDSLLLGFLDTTSTLDNFFEANVQNKETLAKTCREFVVFFRDLKSSLSDATIAAYKKLAQELSTKKP